MNAKHVALMEDVSPARYHPNIHYSLRKAVVCRHVQKVRSKTMVDVSNAQKSAQPVAALTSA